MTDEIRNDVLYFKEKAKIEKRIEKVTKQAFKGIKCVDDNEKSLLESTIEWVIEESMSEWSGLNSSEEDTTELIERATAFAKEKATAFKQHLEDERR